MDELSKKYLKKMAAMCSRREYCEHDIREKLRTAELPHSEINNIIEYLKKFSFINDERYATAYVKDKFQFNGWGKAKIVAMLCMKHIDRTIIENAVLQLQVDSYKEKCLTLLQSKAKSTKAQNISELKNKLLRYAIGRGFDYETSLQCISEITLQANP